MADLSRAEFDALFEDFEREVLHLEMRDVYGTEAEIPQLAKWKVGEPDDLEWLQGWCDTLRRGAARGKKFRRALVVSEPLSEYQRWAYTTTQPLVDAGEDIRWIPRRLVSSIALPGNDAYVIDGALVVWMHYSGNGASTGIETSTNAADINLCSSAFMAVWQLGIPHRDYRPTA
ncbi:DUF6879 family protein [Phytohabitans houttuyneae]|uniref:DUF6879 domain-containing protein n=1 Tax=Phytohabitans houttuyneae TaxID=1076126 RepID=A0A6V8KWL7_9ACTN|nr:DUF6879 family protein [Phytohabitans houttuyneae]GFJ84985.1 hypothetical protein Phou_091650 [Phytohabitans houttuyneae]